MKQAALIGVTTMKQATLNKEVNCTEPSPSLVFPYSDGPFSLVKVHVSLPSTALIEMSFRPILGSSRIGELR